MIEQSGAINADNAANAWNLTTTSGQIVATLKLGSNALADGVGDMCIRGDLHGVR